MKSPHLLKNQRLFIQTLIIGSTTTFAATFSFAAILPYSVRTRNFSSWTPDTRGDTNTVGMAGATVAIPSSISAAETNPAGYAMLTGPVSAQINQTTLSDPRIQRNGEPISSSQWGLSVSPMPWAYSVSYYSSATEGGIYVSPNTGDTVKTEVSVKELRFTVGRSFLNDTLALGASLNLAKAVRELDNTASNAFGLSYRLGMLARLPKHFLIGASFAPEISIGPASHPDPQSIMPGFNQTVRQPMQAAIGLGWVPSRFFTAGLSATYVGNTDNTALLADESITTGATPTWVPRLGARYTLAEYDHFTLDASAGSYFETSRIEGQSSRLHVTGGIEANPYFINLGAGFDFSSGYRNLSVSLGVDIVRTLRAFDIIPKDATTPYRGTLPPVLPAKPKPFLPGNNPDAKTESVERVIEIIENVPQNIKKKVQGKPTTVELKEAKAKQKQKNKSKSRGKNRE